MPNSLSPKFAHRIETGSTVTNIDGNVYRVVSKLSTPDELVFKLANLQGQPCSTPIDFHPISKPMARFASWLKYVLAYNKDLTKIVNSIIEQHGYPTDPKMDWSAYVQEAMAPALAAVSPDFDLQDEAIYQVIVRALLDRNILADFPTAIKKFPQGVQTLPIERQVSEYLKKAFVWRIQEAKKYMQTVQPAEEMSMEQPAHDTEGGEAYSLLDTEENATGTEDYADADAERDFKAFREEFYKWSVKKNKASAFGLALLLTIYWEQVQQAEGELKFGDLTQEWLRRSHLGFDSLKAYNTKLPQVLKDFVQSNVGVMKGKYELMDLIGFLLPKKKEKARPAKASSKSAAGVEGDIAQAKSETDSPGAIDPDIKAALGVSVPMEKFAGIINPRPAMRRGEERKVHDSLKRHKELMDKYVAEGMPREEASRKALREIKGKIEKESSEDLGQCECEWEDCQSAHQGRCPNPATVATDFNGHRSNLCKECYLNVVDFLRAEHGTDDLSLTGFSVISGLEKEGMLGHDFVDADQQAIRPDITPGDTGRVPHGRTQGSAEGVHVPPKTWECRNCPAWGTDENSANQHSVDRNHGIRVLKEAAAIPAGALDIDQPVGVPTENWQCLNCGHEGMLSQHGKCEACGSDAVASMLPAPPEYARYGIDPLKKSGRSLQVLECCGSVTGHHKMDCLVYTKNFDETIMKLPELQKRREQKSASGKWKVLLRDVKGRQREQEVRGETFGHAERNVRKYMKDGEKVVSMTVASKTAAPAPAPVAAPAQAAPAPAPAPATPAVAPPSVVAPPAGTPLALQQQQKPEEPLRHTVPPEIPNRKYHMTSRVLTMMERRRLEKW